MSTRHWIYTVSAALAASVVAEVVTGADVLAGLWDKALVALTWTWAVLTTPAISPLWLIIGGGVCFALLLLYARIQEANEAKKPLWLRSYKEDMIHGVRWRWQYSDSDKPKIRRVRAFCPRCDMGLHPSNWDCPNCDFRENINRALSTTYLTSPPPRDVEILITQEIARRIRTGEYENRLNVD